MTVLDPREAARWCDGLRAALRALRLNLYFPPWAAIADHVRGIGTVPPGARLRIDAATGLPHLEEWLRVRIDRELAPELLERLAPAERAGDAPTTAKAAYFRGLLEVTPLGPGTVRASLVHREADRAAFAVVVDRIELSVPRFVRWTLRIEESAGGRFSVAEMETRASADFSRRLRVIGTQPVAAAVTLLEAEEGLTVEEVVRGEIGPALWHDDGPRLSALLSRASRHLEHTAIDDPLAEEVLIPDDAHFGYARHRKWAVPEGAREAHLDWLRSLGSRNIVYTYRT
ncbi:MAG: hypothetical protein JRI25_11745 [Deltaproteobacteria bacterium]|nr:hypothetical protein [Deltaproteobacteria bacterium]MBW2255259.1 hypothetical protein [Deltaproteobacteria bacterium]